jgi:hypothetical protein
MSRRAAWSPLFLLAAFPLAGCFSSSSGGSGGSASFDAGHGEDVTFPEASPEDAGGGGHDATAEAEESETGADTGTGDAGAGTVAIVVPGLGSGFDYHQGSYSLGWTFVANAAITISSVGLYDDKMNGLTESHPVGVYDESTQMLLAQATVTPQDPLNGYFRYTPLVPPLALQQGKTYVLVALVGTENYLAFNALDPTWTVNPAISYAGGAVNYGNPNATTLLYPDTFGMPDGGGDFGPNFEFTGP